MLAGGRELEREIDLARGLASGRLVVDLGPYTAALSGYAAIARMLHAHPGLQVEAQVADWQTVAGRVLARTSDLGLAEVSEASRHPDLAVDALAQRQAAFVCRTGHPLLSRARVALRQVLDYPWVCTRMPERLAPGSLQGGGKAGHWDPKKRVFVPAVCLDAVFEIGRIVASSDALGLAVRAMVVRELDSGALEILDFRPRWLTTNYGFIIRRGRTPSPAATAFMRLVREVEAEVDRVEGVLAERFGPSSSAG